MNIQYLLARGTNQHKLAQIDERMFQLSDVYRIWQHYGCDENMSNVMKGWIQKKQH